jgi:hypothetical protein
MGKYKEYMIFKGKFHNNYNIRKIFCNVYSIDKEKISNVGILVLQEHESKINMLQNKIMDLEHKNMALEHKLNNIEAKLNDLISKNGL